MRHRFDGFELDVATRTLVGPDGPVHVEPQVFDVLTYLIENRDRAVSKEELLDEVWGDRFVSESALTSRIKAVRRAIGDDGTTQRLVRTVHGHGYRFVGELSGAEPTTVPLRTPAPAVEPVPLAASISLDDEFPFVGRGEEIATLSRLVTRAPPSLAVGLVGGQPGIGKSRLAVEVAERARREAGVLVCAGRCDDNVTVTLQPWRDALAQLARSHPAEFARWCDGVSDVIVRLVPSLARTLGIDVAAGREPDAWAAADAVSDVIAAATATAPVVILIDDLQWSDEPSRSLISLLLRRHPGVALCVLATFRSTVGDADPEFRRWLADVARSSAVHRIDLTPLDRDAVTQLSRSVLGDAGEGETLPDVYRHTDGHALFVTETLRELQRGGTTGTLSPTVSGLVTGRLDRLPGEVRSLVTAGAALGPEFRLPVAARAAGLDLDAAVAAAEIAVGADLVHETSQADRLRFSHRLVPGAVLAALGAARRARLHERCAAALRDTGASSAEVAFHVLEAVPLTPVEVAVREARAAAAVSVEDLQFDQAIRLLERVLRLSIGERETAEVLLALGSAYNAGGRAPAGETSFAKAAELARANGWSDLLAAAALGHQAASPYRRLWDRTTLRLLSEALAREADLDRITRAKLRAKTAAFHLFDWRIDERDRVSAEALHLAEGCGPSDELDLLEFRWVALGCPVMCDELAEIDARLERLRSGLGRVARDAAAPECVHLWRADGASFRSEAFGFMLDAGRRQGMDYWRSFGLRASVALFEGRIDEARGLFDDAAEIGSEHWGDAAVALHVLALQLCDVVDGSTGRALDALSHLHSVDRSAIIGTSLAWEQARAGGFDAARATLASMRPSSLSWFAEHILGGNALVAAGLVALLVEDDTWAAASEEALRPLGDLVLGLPWSPSLAAAEVLAALAARRGDDAAARSWTATADERYRTLGAPALAARLERR